MPESIIEEPGEFSIWCVDEQDYTTFGFPQMDDDTNFMYIQQTGYGMPYTIDQIAALHKWLGKVLEEKSLPFARKNRYYELSDKYWQYRTEEEEVELQELAQLLGYE